MRLSDKKLFLLIIFFATIFSVSGLVSAGTYYVATNGTAAWASCTNINTPCSVSTANSNAVAGDTVYLRGGLYTTTTIQPANSGSSGNYLVFSNYNNENVSFKNLQYCIRLEVKNYIKITGINCYESYQHLRINSGGYNIIDKCTFTGMRYYFTWNGARIFNNSHHNQIINSNFTRWGNTSMNPNPDDNGCWLDIGNDNDANDNADHNLVENCTFAYGAHHLLGNYGKYNIIRNNFFHSENWYNCTFSEIGYKCGSRDIISGGNTTYKKYNLYENNIISYSGTPADSNTSAGFSLRTPNNILRRNKFYANDGSAINLATYSGGVQYADNNHIYNNVFYNNSYPALPVASQEIRDLTAIAVQRHSGFNLVNASFKNNAFYLNRNDVNFYFYYVNPWDQIFEGNWEIGDPKFTDIAGQSPTDPNCFNFYPQANSPLIENGVFLTTVTSSNGTANNFNVFDAGYFMDGYEMIEGDVIQLQGSSTKLKITSVNYTTNKITVNQSVSFYNGQGVALAYTGSYPDIGAYEYTGTINNLPTHSTPKLQASSPNNLTTDDLTVYNQSTSDSDGDFVKNLINWQKNSNLISALSMPFEGGGFVKDYSGKNKNVSVSGGVAWSSAGGYDGRGGFSFDGFNDYINVSGNNGNNALDFNNNFTISVWFKAAAVTSSHTIVGRAAASYFLDPGEKGYYLLLRDESGVDSIIFNVGGSTNSTNLKWAGGSDGKWHHVVGVRAGNEHKLYVDGALRNSTITNVGDMSNTGNSLYIGKGRAAHYYFNGSLDELVLYNISLSPEQILALYQNKTNFIANQETEIGNTWKACITPNDGKKDGTELCSNTLTILNESNNTAPVLAGIPDNSTNEDTAPPTNWIDLYPYASDAEDSDDALTFSIDSETNSSLIDCSISGDRYLSCGTPASNQTGYNDVTVKVIDTGSLTDTDVVRITVNPVNDAQTITTASDSPDPVTVGNDVTFSVDWNDVDDTTTRIHICKTNSITGQSCNGGNWCESPSFTSNDPATCAYTTQSADIATSPNNYYAFACDDDNACSSSSSGTFSVQSAGNNPPTHSTPKLNASSPNNLTTDDLTVYNQSTSDSDGDSVKNIINWYKNSNSISVLNMPFEGESNSTFTKDYSKTSNGVVSGASWNSAGGYDGKGAYTFDGINDYINLSTNEAYNFGNNFTISLWFKATSAQVPNIHMMAGRAAVDYYLDTTERGYYLLLRNSSGIRSVKFNVGGSTNATELTYNGVADGLWHLAVGVKSGNTILLYVDGVHRSNTTRNFGNTSSPGNSLYIGRDRGTQIRWFNGSLDDIMFYNIALSPQQILALYQNKTNFIVNQETSVGEVWKACITPNDGKVDGTELCSNELTILE